MSTESSSPPRWKYDVFLSFRGEDTRKGFIDHLYSALEHQRIITFRDDPALQKGEAISPALFAAIEQSKFALIVLSQNYAWSNWCLDGLVRILERMKAREMVLPVFYGVDPSDVQKQTGSFKEAFIDHEERFKDDKEKKVQRWRSALTEVASFSGWNSKEWYESKLIRDIVEVIWTKLQPTSFSYAENLVGIYSRLQPINFHLDVRVDDVRYIGIWGVGGIGKTTLVRAVYERISREFEFSFLLTDVRRNSVENGGLLNLQKQLLSGILTKKADISDLHEGATIIRRLLGHRKVLLILDDVNHSSHLKFLAGNQDWFGSGSRVLITTRNEHLLIGHGVERRMKAEELNDDDEEEEEAENEEEEDVVNELRTYDLLLSRLYSMYEEELVMDYEKLKISEHITKIKDLMSNMVTGNRHEDILRLIHGAPVAVINDRKCTINDPECIEDFNRIYDQMVELKKKSDHTYSAVMRTSKSTWSELPAEVFELIVKKFVPSAFNDILIFKHILSFRAVCHTWRNAAKALFPYTLLPQTPWLLVHTRCKSSIVDPEQKKVYEIQNVYGDRHHDVMCKGSSHGWMVVFHMNRDVRESLAYVVNPITRARTQIPGMATLSDSEWHSVEITKVVLSSDRSSNNFSVIVAYCIQRRSVTGALAFCKNGDTSWSKLDYPHKYIFHDILFHHDHLFALTKKQSLYVWDFTESYPKMIFNIADTTPLRSVGHSYLVESMGEVLRVVRGGENTNSAHFLVEKLNVKDKKWEKVQNLGDQSLFLFHDQSMSLPKTCFLGSEDNSIYFLQGGWLARGVINRYNLETTEVRRINSLSDLIGKELSSEELEFRSFPPVWVVPSL